MTGEQLLYLTSLCWNGKTNSINQGSEAINIYELIRKWKGKAPAGIQINQKKTNSLLYADNIVLMDNSDNH